MMRLLGDKAVWTEEQKKQASERAKARWADPEYRKKQGKAISKQPCCPSCNETNIEKFYVDKNGTRTNKHCRECHKAECNRRWHARPALDRWASRNYLYGVTKEFLLDLYEKQQGKCAICGEEPKTTRGLHIDHCHKTGAVRGLLCHGCNTGIGALQDDPKVIEKALNYLKGY
jgi:hypothetical protein